MCTYYSLTESIMIIRISYFRNKYRPTICTYAYIIIISLLNPEYKAG